MSYDVGIGDFSANYTSNVSSLFYDHFRGADGLRGLNGMTGKQCALEIAEFWSSLDSMRHNLWSSGAVGEPKLTQKYDAPNGWGSMIGALIMIGQLQSACAANPRKIVWVSS